MTPLDEDDVTRARWERAAGIAIVAACTGIVFAIVDAGHHFDLHHFRFGLLFTDTTTNGGDMGAHVWWPWFLEHTWFPKLRLSGWAPSWYAGFPVGQYYFPVPALMVAVLNDVLFVPYNVAFKLVTASGVLMLPAAAYYFARGMRTAWPTPPAFAVAALGMLVETRDQWQIYGGNIASSLAGEFSFGIGLALALFALGALARTLDTGERRWLPALLIGLAIMSHIVIAVFVAVVATLLWLVRRPQRTWPLAVAVGAVGVAVTAVWLVPLVARQKYGQSMRYTKVVSQGSFTAWSWLPGPVRRLLVGIVNGVGRFKDPSTGKHVPQPLWLPWWVWALAAVAIVAAGWYRRRSTLVLLLAAAVWGVVFVEWPQDFAIWNTRFLPFWLFTWGLLAATGAAEIVRLAGSGARWAYSWVREGDVHDSRARAWAEIATAPDGTVAPALRERAVQVLVARRFEESPPGWEPPAGLDVDRLARHRRLVGAGTVGLLVVGLGAVAIHHAWDARDNRPAIAIAGWASWNYSGYERKPVGDPTGRYKTSKEYFDIMHTMSSLADTNGPGRALWEPSSEPGADPINNYGTSLALELLPYFTHGRIDSMEGLYFESSATTAFHFLTVSECSQHPSNPVRGLRYGTLADDFDLCVEHLQMLGVRYLMLWTPEAEAKADASPQLRLVRTVPDVDGADPKGWKVYEVRSSALVEGLRRQPVVVAAHAGTESQCFHTPKPPSEPGSDNDPRLGTWECPAVYWFTSRALVDKPWAASGPKEWTRLAGIDQLAGATQPTLPHVDVTNVVQEPDKVSFHVSRPGVPVVVKVSYYPSWKAHGARGPYRLAPNLMVVVPTANDVSLTYDVTSVDWLGRLVTLAGLAGLVLLWRWRGARRFAAEGPFGHDASEPALAGRGHEGGREERGDGEGEGRPPRPAEPEPALP